ncbi:MAG: acyl-CoA dehydrogenase family protein [Burkholderiaceae bacterium]|nr:acyl-CoA dehydrogenase family protein [Burkholderiaceae bacterium]
MSIDPQIVRTLHDIAAGSPAAPVCEQIADWWPSWQAIAHQASTPMAVAVMGGALADRAGWAFAAGYQASLRALLREQPGLLAGTTMSAFCVTEEGGNRPADIQCRLEPVPGGHRLFGAKRWSTLGPESNRLLVAVRVPPHDAARPNLRMVQVRADATGVTVTTMPPTRFVPEIPHARLAFDGVDIAEDDVLPGDGYERYIKPFRTVEDIHVNAALLTYLLAEAGRRGWPGDWRERALIALLGLAAVGELDPAAPLTHLALAGALAGSGALVEEAHSLWQLTPDDPASQRWARDASLFGVASGARQQRTVRAWERLAAS